MRCKKWGDRVFLDKARQTCERSPETYREIEDVVEFYEVYPEISDLSMWAVRPLMRERNKKVQLASVNAVIAQMKRRANVNSSDFSLARATLTGEQVREILSEQHILIEGTDIQREKLVKLKEAGEKEKESIYTCPFFLNLPEEEKTKYGCRGLLIVKSTKRDKIVSLRVAEDLDNALSYLAKRLDVSRSLLVSEILAMKAKFPESTL